MDMDLIQTSLSDLDGPVDRALNGLREKDILERIWNKDHTVWDPNPRGITNRLNWLTIAERIEDELGSISTVVEGLRQEGFRQALLMGMGGSSLAPQVFRKTFGVRQGYLDLQVLDSTDPKAVSSMLRSLDPERTVYIVATKSGTTVETLSFFKYFYNQAAEMLGTDRVGRHFMAITAPDSPLSATAARLQFREIFLADPEIGGRYSALSLFGLVPAALIGMDLTRLLERAQRMGERCRAHIEPLNNPAALLGTILGASARLARDKLTLVTSPELASFGDWVEQLIAESTGKSGKGILPVVGESLGSPEVYAFDRIFVYLHLPGAESREEELEVLSRKGYPLIRMRLQDRYDLGGQFFLWDLATAVAGHHLGIHPFNQPDVEAAKVRAREMVDQYQKEGQLPEGETAPIAGETLARFLSSAVPGDKNQGLPRSYIALQAYLQPTPEIDGALHRLRMALRDSTALATTLGYGPRFLHSTGQLHKGDGGHGLFVQLTSEVETRVPIPERAGEQGTSIDFGTLKNAQALGDWHALKGAGRRVIRFHSRGDIIGDLESLRKPFV